MTSRAAASVPPINRAGRRRKYDPECVSAYEPGRFWLLSCFDDVLPITRQHERDLNSVQNVVPAVVTTGKRPPLHVDPPEHALWPKAMSGPFKRSALAELEPRRRALTIERLTPSSLAGAASSSPARLQESGRGFLEAFQDRDLRALEGESRGLVARSCSPEHEASPSTARSSSHAGPSTDRALRFDPL